jgi:MFS family permease
VDVGTKAGPALGTFLAGMLSAQYGWRTMFIALGAGSALWLVPWMLTAKSKPVVERRPPEGPGLMAVARTSPAWATFLGLLCFNYAFYFLLTWLPTYLMNERHFSKRMMAVYAGLPFAVTAVASLVFGKLSDRWIASGRNAVDVRRNTLVAGLLVTGLTLPFATVGDDATSMAFLVVAFIGIGVTTSNVWALTMTLAGRAASQWTGLQNAVGNLGGVIAPIATGYIVERTGSFHGAFVAASAMLLLSAAIYGLWLGRREPVRW